MLTVGSPMASQSLFSATPSAGEGVRALHSQAARPVNVPLQPSQSPPASQSTPRSIQEGQSGSDVRADASKQPSQNEQAGQVEQTRQIEQVIAQLQARDREVRAHEMAHLAAAGGYATGGASYVYQAGPDGKRYAIGGEVGIDTSAVPGDPEATLQKAMVVQRAALAPAEPSAQDLKVAGLAMQMAAQACIEMAQQSQQPVQTQQAGEAEDADAESNTVEPATILPKASEVSAFESSAAMNSLVQVEQANGLLAARAQFERRLSLQG